MSRTTHQRPLLREEAIAALEAIALGNITSPALHVLAYTPHDKIEAVNYVMRHLEEQPQVEEPVPASPEPTPQGYLVTVHLLLDPDYVQRRRETGNFSRVIDNLRVNESDVLDWALTKNASGDYDTGKMIDLVPGTEIDSKYEFPPIEAPAAASPTEPDFGDLRLDDLVRSLRPYVTHDDETLSNEQFFQRVAERILSDQNVMYVILDPKQVERSDAMTVARLMMILSEMRQDTIVMRDHPDGGHPGRFAAIDPNAEAFSSPFYPATNDRPYCKLAEHNSNDRHGTYFYGLYLPGLCR